MSSFYRIKIGPELMKLKQCRDLGLPFGVCDVTHFDEENSRSRLYNVASILLQPFTHLLDACNIHIASL